MSKLVRPSVGRELAKSQIEHLAQELEKRPRKVGFLKMLSGCADTWHYSLNNGFLIRNQMPEATKVYGEKTWLQLGRQIKEGAQPITVLAPAGKAGFPFIDVFVYDISQTSRIKRVPRGLMKKKMLKYARPKKTPVDLALRDLEAGAKLLGISITTTPANAWKRPGARGYAQKTSVHLVNSLSPADRLNTLVHEMAHVLLHTNERDDIGRPVYRASEYPCLDFLNGATERREAEAEATAYVVLRALGHKADSLEYLHAVGVAARDILLGLRRTTKAAQIILYAMNGERKTWKIPNRSSKIDLRNERIAQGFRRGKRKKTSRPLDV